MTTDDRRAAYLSGDSSVLDADEQRALDGIRGVLADPAVWEDPRAGLEAEVVAAISNEDGADATQARRQRRLLVFGAAATLVLAAAAITFRSRQRNALPR